jgi:hypothetical protein
MARSKKALPEKGGTPPVRVSRQPLPAVRDHNTWATSLSAPGTEKPNAPPKDQRQVGKREAQWTVGPSDHKDRHPDDNDRRENEVPPWACRSFHDQRFKLRIAALERFPATIHRRTVEIFTGWG